MMTPRQSAIVLTLLATVYGGVLVLFAPQLDFFNGETDVHWLPGAVVGLIVAALAFLALWAVHGRQDAARLPDSAISPQRGFGPQPKRTCLEGGNHGVTDEKKVKMQKSKCKTEKWRAATLASIPGFDFCILRFDFLSVLSAKPRHDCSTAAEAAPG